MSTQLEWDLRFMRLVKHEVSTWSKDPSTQVGAVIVDANRHIVSTGYNGFARGVRDTSERLNNRDVKLGLTIHAEHNAVLFSKQELTGCTCYTHPFMPCERCASVLIQKGITRVVSWKNDNPRWQDSFKLATEIFAEAGVELVLLDKVDGRKTGPIKVGDLVVMTQPPFLLGYYYSPLVDIVSMQKHISSRTVFEVTSFDSSGFSLKSGTTEFHGVSHVRHA